MDWTPGYREWTVPEMSSRGISCLWVRVVGPQAWSTAMVLPDACVDLIWQMGRGVFVAGPDTGPAPVLLGPGTVMVGARFAPGAGGPALGVSLANLRDLRVELRALGRDRSADLPPDLPPATALRGLATVAFSWADRYPADSLVVAAAALLGEPRTRVGELGRLLGVSERQLRRHFDAAAGYGPKTLQRVLRFQRFLARVGSDARAPLAALALDAGYADQAHLTREAAELSGRTPSALAALVAAEREARRQQTVAQP